MRSRFQYLLAQAAVVIGITAPPALGATIDLKTINKYFNPADCQGASKGGCPVTFSNGKDGLIYLTTVTYNPKLIPNPGQMVTVDLGYKISPGGSLIECMGATTSGRNGKCNDGSSPAKNNVAGVLTFPKNDTNIYFFTGNMEKNFTDKGGYGDQPSYVQYNYLYSELGIKTPDLSIGTTPIMITTEGVTGYFRMIQGGRNERLFLTLPAPEASTWAMMLVGLGVLGAAMRARRRRAAAAGAPVQSGRLRGLRETGPAAGASAEIISTLKRMRPSALATVMRNWSAAQNAFGSSQSASAIVVTAWHFAASRSDSSTPRSSRTSTACSRWKK